MDAVLVDTNVVSYCLKRDSRAQRYAEDMRDRRLCLAFVTVAELRLWAIVKKWGPARVESLEASLRHYVILPFDDALTWEWARIAAHQRSKGRNLRDPSDWWIAACAIRHKIPLITHNPSDFQDIPGLVLITR